MNQLGLKFVTNTYGLHSINKHTFNVSHERDLWYTKGMRDVIVTFLRVHNLVLNILGYLQTMPHIPVISGCVRMGTGALLATFTLLTSLLNAQDRGVFIPQAPVTAIAQIARGALEAFIPWGWAVNASLDCVATLYNTTPATTFCKCMGPHPSYPNPSYPLPLRLLQIV